MARIRAIGNRGLETCQSRKNRLVFLYVRRRRPGQVKAMDERARALTAALRAHDELGVLRLFQ